MAKNMFPGVALVTGAGSGIGQTIAVSFASEGCRKIAIADLNSEGLQETLSLIADASDNAAQVIEVKTDVSAADAVVHLLQKTVEVFGRVDYAVNAAGILSMDTRSHETSIESFDRILAVDYKGCWLCSREEIKHMLDQEPLQTHDGRSGNRGSIVNIASQLGIVARPTAPAYCSAKAAIIGLTKADAIDYSKDNIRINCVCPGVIGTPMVVANLEALQPQIDMAPMRRCGTSQEVADCVLFLCSSKATFVQGSAFVVDGGYTII